MLNANYYWALRYLNRGFSVMPLHPKTKTPMVKWEEFQTRRPTNAELIKWFHNEPNANIGLICGAVSGLVVVDVDPRNGGSIELREVGKGPRVSTGGGGRHYYYRFEEGMTKGKLLPGVDFQSEGSFVVAPPSSTVSQYKFDERFNLNEPLELVPEWVKKFVQEKGEKSFTHKNVASFSNVIEGGRNNHLTSLAGSMRRRGMSSEAIETALQVENKTQCSPPLPENEVQTIASSVSRYQPEQTPTLTNKTLSTYDLLAYEGSVEWVVDGLIPLGGTTIFSGLPGRGKTWLLLALALSLSLGGLWLKRFSLKQRKVLYVDEENSLQLLKQRLNKLIRKDSTPSNDLLRFRVSQGLNLSSPASFEAFDRELTEYKPDVVVVDSLVRVHREEENSSTAMSGVFSKVKQLMDRHKIAFIFADHENKAAYQVGDAERLPSLSDLRGTNEKSAFADSVLSLRYVEGLLSIFHLKSRWGVALLPIYLKIEDTSDNKVNLESVNTI